MKVYVYEKCSTCTKALAYLKSTGRAFETLPIREQPPTKAELRTMLKIYGAAWVACSTPRQGLPGAGPGEKLKTMGETRLWDFCPKTAIL